jgi:hypothetical protein
MAGSGGSCYEGKLLGMKTDLRCMDNTIIQFIEKLTFYPTNY